MLKLLPYRAKIANSPLDLAMTACVVVVGCPVVAAWRSTGSICDLPSKCRPHRFSISTPLAAGVELTHLEIAWTVCKNKLVLSSRQRVASHAHYPEVPRISKSSPLGTFVQSSLDTERIQHVGHDFDVSWICSTVKEWHTVHRLVHRLLLLRDAVEHSDFSFRSDVVRTKPW